MRFRLLLLLLAVILLGILSPVQGHRKGYLLRRGSRLERQHRRSLHEWKKLHRHRHHKKRHSPEFDDILLKMDSFIRPRFG